ncbi:hypothetical protein K440DRAFT_614537 [Wilcoxina mikolae CBS 423.85]|nr:hypothetical protein K440DRAFT_614537 [Wilcoxina mikolae CBS 423.85]
MANSIHLSSDRKHFPHFPAPMSSSAPSISPVAISANRPGYDLDQRMQVFMAEKAGSNESSATRMTPVRPWIPPAIDTSATYYTRGPSANVVARTERWRTGTIPEYPTPPNSNSPDVEFPMPPTLGHPRDGFPSSPGMMQQQQQQQQHSRSSSRENSAIPGRQQSHSRSGTTEERTIYVADPRLQRLIPSPPFSPPILEDYPIIRSPPRSRGHPVRFPTRVDSMNTQFSMVGMNRAHSTQGQNPVDRWVAGVSPPEVEVAETIRPRTSSSASSSTTGRKAPEKKSGLLENVLGIYPAENKLPPGRSTADALASQLAKKLHLGKKNSSQPASLHALKASSSTTDLRSENNRQTTKHSSAPTRGMGVRNDTLAGSFYSPSLHLNYPCGPDGRLLAELPGSIPGECENNPAKPQLNGISPILAEEDSYSQDSRSASERSAGGPRPKSRRGRRRFGDRPPKPSNERAYAKMPLPSIPPIPSSSPEPPPPPPEKVVPRARLRAGSRRARSSISPKDIADWAECLMNTTAAAAAMPPVPPLPRSFSMPVPTGTSHTTITEEEESLQASDGVVTRSLGFPPPQLSISSSHSRKSSLSRSSTNSTAPSSFLRSALDGGGSRESSASSVAFDACVGLGTIGEDTTSPLHTPASVNIPLHSPELPLPLHSPAVSEIPLHSPASEISPQKPPALASPTFPDQPDDDDEEEEEEEDVLPLPTQQLEQRFNILSDNSGDDKYNNYSDDDSIFERLEREEEEEESRLPDTLDEILDAMDHKLGNGDDVGNYTSFFDDYYYNNNNNPKSEEEKEEEELQYAIDEMLTQEQQPPAAGPVERRPSELSIAEYDTTTLDVYLKGLI